MTTSFFRLFAILLGIELCSAAQGFGHEKEEPKKTPFQETANSLLVGCGMQLVEYGYFPHFTSWSRVKGDFVDAAAFQKRCKDFPDDLMKALGNRESLDHEAAAAFLASYVSMARSHAAKFSEKDLSVAVDHALAPHTGKIREALVASFQSKAASTRLLAALVLLCLDESHVKANEVLQTSVMSVDAKFLSETSQFIGLAHLTSPQAINYLRRLLKHRDKSVRHAAASAVITLGRSARDLAPALIDLLETGKDAEGSYEYPFAIAALPESGNLALMALESLGEHAKPAVPAILKRFAKANDEDQLTMLACLARSGDKGDACLAVVRKALRSKKTKLKLAAAGTLLHLAPHDREATGLLKKALADDTTKNLALEMCQQFGPPSREIVASLISMLDDKSEDVRISATSALAAIGPQARQAVPGLEKLLAKEREGLTHTFHSTRAAAHALAKIRGKEAAAALLRVADSKTSGAGDAIMYLPELGVDLPPPTAEVLVRALTSDDGTKEMAAIALSNLGERARPVRRELERMLDDSEVGWIIDTALRRIPANPR
jgi:HEAT repeat protein